MIKTLRRKFITVTMAAVFSVLFLIVASINAVNIYQNNKSLDTVTEIIFENGGSFRKDNAFDKIKPSVVPDADYGLFDPDYKDKFHNKEELPFSTRYFTVSFDEEGIIINQDLTNIASVTDTEASDIAAEIFKNKTDVGWYKNYRYRVGKTEKGYILIAMEATSFKSSVLTTFGITALVSLAALVAVLVLVLILSDRAIKPISETYEKQKQFITDASHELKTPLTVISANAEVLSLTNGADEWSLGIIRQADHMRALIGQMIQMAKLDEGKQTLEFAEFDLSEAVLDTALTFRGPAGAKEVTIETDIKPDIRLNGDEAAIRQLVSILVDNAVKYCDANGTIRVSLAKENKSFSKGKSLLSVKNTFLHAEDIDTDKLFERFYRADKAHTCGNGYGLGLSIAKSIAEHHNGRITASKLPDKTVVFNVAL